MAYHQAKLKNMRICLQAVLLGKKYAEFESKCTFILQNDLSAYFLGAFCVFSTETIKRIDFCLLQKTGAVETCPQIIFLFIKLIQLQRV